jgi:Uma2 family endonuclease
MHRTSQVNVARVWNETAVMSTKSEIRLGVADHGANISRDEFAEAQYDEPWRYERVNGKLVVMTPAGHDHQKPTNRIRDYLGAYALRHPDVIEYVFSEAWVSTDDGTDRIADIGIFLTASRNKGTGTGRAPDLIFETVSGGGEDRQRDYVDKRAEYQKAGVKEYVIVDRFEERVTVLRRSRGRFVASELGPGDTYTSPLLPGLKIPLRGII